MRLSGARVVIPESKTVIVPWSEKIRYGIKKNGYHGGVTPQEMITPIAVLSPSETYPDGWIEVPVDMPSWWEEPDLVTPVPNAMVPHAPVAVAAPSRPKPAKPQQTKLLFNPEDETGSPAESGSTANKQTGWVGDLFQSPIFEQQKKLAGRSVPSDDVLRNVLSALEQRGGRLTSAALSRAVNYPTMRLRGLIAVMQRVLNIDGFAVLTKDEASDTVDLNRELLKRQFDLR
jgi:hypothetical protein